MQFIEVARNVHHVHLLTAVIAAIVLVFVFACSHFAPKFPGPLVAVAGAIAASAYWNFAGRGVNIVGPVVGGLPHLGLPDVSWSDAFPLIGVSASCFVMIVAQSAATARFYAARHQQQQDENQDLIGLSAANAAAAFSGTFVVNGSPTQTAMVESSGGKSQLAQVATALVVALVLLFLTGPLQYLPRCVLGAIVFFIAVRLIDLRGLLDIRRESPGEYALALVTAAIVVLVGVEQGILVAMVLSLLRVVAHSYRPHTGVLVAGEDGAWRTESPDPGTMTEPGIVIYRFSAPLFYANAGRFAEDVHHLVGVVPSQVRWLVVDAEAITNIDYSAARTVRRLHQDLLSEGTVLAFARVSPSLQSDLARHGLVDAIGQAHIFFRLHDALASFAKYGNRQRRSFGDVIHLDPAADPHGIFNSFSST